MDRSYRIKIGCENTKLCVKQAEYVMKQFEKVGYENVTIHAYDHHIDKIQMIKNRFKKYGFGVRASATQTVGTLQ